MMTIVTPAVPNGRDIVLEDYRGGLPEHYEPAHGLKRLQAAELGEKHFRRARDSAGLYEAVRAKLGEQRRFVLWWDQQEKNPGGNPSQTNDGLLPRQDLPTAYDFGLTRETIRRWRKRLKKQLDFDKAIEKAHERCVKVCEARQGHSDYARATCSGENEWYTPPEYVDAAREALGGTIDLDPASNLIAQETVQARVFFTIQDDALSRRWFGTVFLNPPYAQPAIEHFSDKIVEEFTAGRVTEAVMLTNNSADTKWFQKAAAHARVLCFTNGRIEFVSPRGDAASPTQGQTFFYFGPNPAAFARTFGRFGLVVERYRDV